MELRKDYLLDRFVIIAAGRGKRPSQFRRERESKKVKVCYFCPGKEHTTPPEITRWPAAGDWKIRCFPNKFPAVSMDEDCRLKKDGFLTHASAYGRHEVIVETPEHDKELANLTVRHITRLLKCYAERIDALLKLQGVKYVSVFKNSGAAAGTSLVHSHSQIIGYNIIPPIIKEKEEAAKGKKCIFRTIIKNEMQGMRRINSLDTMVSFAPYASRFPFEAWILPKRHVISITQFTDDEYTDMAKLLKKLLRRLADLNAPFNFYLHYGIRHMHFQLVLIPRLAKWAGFEHATGTIINTMSPEDAARFYRGK